MRITKEKAQNVAKKLVEAKKEKLELKIGKLKEFSYELAKSKTPKEVLEIFESQKDFINTSSQVQFVNINLNDWYLRRVNLDSDVPVSYNHFTITDAEAKVILKMNNDIEKYRDEILKLQDELEVAILKMNTYKRCENEFPEAFALLPKEHMSTSLMINISSLREKLKN